MYSADKLPLPAVAVTLAFVLEVICGVALLVGWRTRIAAAALVPYIALLTVLFHMTFASQVEYGFFIDHLLLIAGLLYVAGHGAQHFAVRKDAVVESPAA